MKKSFNYDKKYATKSRNQIVSMKTPITVKAEVLAGKISDIKAFKLLNDLISFQTDDIGKEHEACLKYIEEYVKKVNSKSITERIRSKDKDALIIGINVNKLRDIHSGIMFCGHIDVVEDKKEHFKAIISENKIYGRGTADMKGSIAGFLNVIPYLNRIKIPAILCFTCDEETNMRGIQDVCAFLKKNNIYPTMTILGEPTDNQLGICSTGIQSYQTIVRGISAHSSTLKKGINALFVASRIVQHLEKIAQSMQSKELYLNVGALNGGGNIAVIPDKAQIDWGFRYALKDNAVKVMKKYNKMISKITKQYLGVSIETIQTDEFIGYTADKTKQIRELCKKLHLKPIKLSYTSEAGYLAKIGQNAYLLGVGSIALAHSDNEYIFSNDLRVYQELLIHIIESIQTPF